jgi:hypothetical protein
LIVDAVLIVKTTLPVFRVTSEFIKIGIESPDKFMVVPVSVRNVIDLEPPLPDPV